MDSEIWIQLIIYLGSLCTTIGTILSKIKTLEKKVDRHNRFMERIIILEQRSKLDNKRIDEIVKRMED